MELTAILPVSPWTLVVTPWLFADSSPLKSNEFAAPAAASSCKRNSTHHQCPPGQWRQTPARPADKSQQQASPNPERTSHSANQSQQQQASPNQISRSCSIKSTGRQRTGQTQIGSTSTESNAAAACTLFSCKNPADAAAAGITADPPPPLLDLDLKLNKKGVHL